tara:strand:- start:57 stop:725 length:669 start_codon:yes stop_codon:yes gene_type:complete
MGKSKDLATISNVGNITTLKVDDIQTQAGAAPTLGDLAITGTGTVLQEICGVCDGRTVSGITFPNVTQEQNATTTMTDMTGSEIAYTPPAGTTTVIYSLQFCWGTTVNSGISHWKFFIDGTHVSIYDRTEAWAYSTTEHGVGVREFYFPILIGQGDDIANGKVNTWTSNKTMKLQYQEYDGSYQSRIHHRRYISQGTGGTGGSGGVGGNAIQRPILKLKALA